jgi:hypothetical protein
MLMQFFATPLEIVAWISDTMSMYNYNIYILRQHNSNWSLLAWDLCEHNDALLNKQSPTTLILSATSSGLAASEDVKSFVGESIVLTCGFIHRGQLLTESGLGITNPSSKNLKLMKKLKAALVKTTRPVSSVRSGTDGKIYPIKGFRLTQGASDAHENGIRLVHDVSVSINSFIP